jgi:O-antigen ligase
MIGDNPIAGIGFGEHQFTAAMKDYGFETQFGVEALDAPHNSFLQIAVYAGVPALLVFLLCNAMLLAGAGRRSFLSDDPTSPAIFGIAVGILCFLVAIFPDLQLFTASVAPVYWVFLGLLLALTAEGSSAVKAAPVSAAATVPVTRWTMPGTTQVRPSIVGLRARGSRPVAPSATLAPGPFVHHGPVPPSKR